MMAEARDVLSGTQPLVCGSCHALLGVDRVNTRVVDTVEIECPCGNQITIEDIHDRVPTDVVEHKEHPAILDADGRLVCIECGIQSEIVVDALPKPYIDIGVMYGIGQMKNGDTYDEEKGKDQGVLQSITERFK